MFARSALFALLFALASVSLGRIPMVICEDAVHAEERGLQATLMHGEERLVLTAQGPENAQVLLRVATVAVTAAGVPTGSFHLAELPIVLDAAGQWTTSLDLRAFEGHADADFYVELVGLPALGDPHPAVSLFKVSLRNQSLTDPNAPLQVGGGVVTGTSPTGQTLVSSWAHLLTSGASPHWMRWSAAPHGVEGVIPVN